MLLVHIIYPRLLTRELTTRLINEAYLVPQCLATTDDCVLERDMLVIWVEIEQLKQNQKANRENFGLHLHPAEFQPPLC
jgi:hypothetical protein